MRILMVFIALGIGVANGVPVAFPDSPVYYGGFQPVDGARSVQDYGGDQGGSVAQSAGPSKTIYVNVPHPDPVPAPKPIAAGPPRKHYKIVFIRAPVPPPPPQPILPPRTEQKTIIYVLHQKQEPQQQQIINVPQTKHNPEVYFVQYDKPPTAEELQQLSTGDLSSFGVSQSYGTPGDSLGSGSSQSDIVPAGAPIFDVRSVDPSGSVGVPLSEAVGSLGNNFGNRKRSADISGDGNQLEDSSDSASERLNRQNRIPNIVHRKN